MLDGSRREARERAVGLLYEADIKGVTVSELVDDLQMPLEEYAAVLIGEVGKSQEEIDQQISSNLKDWTFDRLPIIDRNILRVSVAELISQSDVPTAVVIDEAVELAKQFSTDESGKFINGVLSSVAQAVR